MASLRHRGAPCGLPTPSRAHIPSWADATTCPRCSIWLHPPPPFRSPPAPPPTAHLRSLSLSTFRGRQQAGRPASAGVWAGQAPPHGSLRGKRAPGEELLLRRVNSSRFLESPEHHREPRERHRGPRRGNGRGGQVQDRRGGPRNMAYAPSLPAHSHRGSVGGSAQGEPGDGEPRAVLGTPRHLTTPAPNPSPACPGDGASGDPGTGLGASGRHECTAAPALRSAGPAHPRALPTCSRPSTWRCPPPPRCARGGVPAPPLPRIRPLPPRVRSPPTPLRCPQVTGRAGCWLFGGRALPSRSRQLVREEAGRGGLAEKW